ncbi:hypothetical protein HZA96_00725 [Candidatus Woesearchaeota archaeon]|nr:hypothetical protein [Candidatus Woesearchaeota archaeon]
MKAEQLILEKLEKIEKNIEDIREHMVDADIILTEDERKLVEDSYENEKKGKLLSSKQLKKELGL